MDQNELPLDKRHLEVPSGVLERISRPMQHSTQTIHYLAPILTLSKPNKTSFYFTHVT
jgi:hypothetical protein